MGMVGGLARILKGSGIGEIAAMRCLDLTGLILACESSSVLFI
jgi:hypothetical protein